MKIVYDPVRKLLRSYQIQDLDIKLAGSTSRVLVIVGRCRGGMHSPFGSVKIVSNEIWKRND